MFGMPPSLQDPVASFEVSTHSQNPTLYHNQHPGTRGFASLPDSLATGVVGNNNALTIQSKWARPKIGAITIQFGILGPNAPLRLYENGIPATLLLNPNPGFQLAATFPGIRGNRLSLTVNLPLPYPAAGVTTPLVIKAVPPGQIVVTLATTGNGQNTAPTVTTTGTLLVAALNAVPGVREWVEAWGTGATPLTAIPQTYFRGGTEVPYLVYVSTVANTSGVISTTGAQVAALLTGSKFVGATNTGASTGAGAVTQMGPTALVGGRLSAGGILDEDATKLSLYRFNIKQGQGIEHMTNYGLQVAQTRQGANRTWQAVPTQDRAILISDLRNTVGSATGVAGSAMVQGIDHAMEHGPRSLFL